jgi:hypothetical protein
MEVEESARAPFQQPLTWRGRVAELTAGITIFKLANNAFDYALYPFVIYKLGIIKGGLIMTFLASLTNLFCLKFYDWSKRDWLGIEALKGMKGYEGKNRLARFMSGILKKSDTAAFFFFSIKEDAFVTMVYLRHGSYQYNGMSARDWRILLASLAVANVYWTLAAYMGLSLMEWVWRVFSGKLPGGG